MLNSAREGIACVGEVYQHPKYYEIAFSFRDIGAEVDVFEELIQRYSRIPVTRLLEVGCGPAPHLSELTQRGYTYIGLDLSEEMLAYAHNRAQTLQAPTTFIVADMRYFRLHAPVDFAFVLLGSLFVQSTTDLTAHFDAMSLALEPGGLYLLDWCINFTTHAGRPETWTLAQDGITVTTTYEARIVNAVEQTIEERLTLAVEEPSRTVTLHEVTVRREVYPQEFLLFLAQRADFEFIGWWNNWDITRPLNGTQAIQRPITVVRRV
jgi:SAM-dependent methyltransferase